MYSVIRLGAQRVAPSFSRSISMSAVARKDLIQDLYAKDASAGLVRNYTAPTPPKAPALPSDLAGELAKFDATEPVIGATEAKETPIAEEGEGADEYLTFLEKDLPKAAAHH
ncbi:hypothetical protein EHS25_001682 [Saitozyma podzolica]|uniref:ATP synthase F0 subcomplex subunit H atp14 n=1 Tax=Saitozyma podzolica TaxID=1890683 RepID=A0A427YGY8_9TREE|nr:hypothetical protein EHS25_001682 [Saitozyma podzolica]